MHENDDDRIAFARVANDFAQNTRKALASFFLIRELLWLMKTKLPNRSRPWVEIPWDVSTHRHGRMRRSGT